MQFWRSSRPHTYELQFHRSARGQTSLPFFVLSRSHFPPRPLVSHIPCFLRFDAFTVKRFDCLVKAQWLLLRLPCSLSSFSLAWGSAVHGARCGQGDLRLLIHSQLWYRRGLLRCFLLHLRKPWHWAVRGGGGEQQTVSTWPQQTLACGELPAGVGSDGTSKVKKQSWRPSVPVSNQHHSDTGWPYRPHPTLLHARFEDQQIPSMLLVTELTKTCAGL